MHPSHIECTECAFDSFGCTYNVERPIVIESGVSLEVIDLINQIFGKESEGCMIRTPILKKVSQLFLHVPYIQFSSNQNLLR